jgi:hypothetical protein
MEYLGKWNGKKVIKVNRNDYSPLETDVYQVVMHNSKEGYLIEGNYHAVGKVSIERGQYVIDNCDYNLKEWFAPKVKEYVGKRAEISVLDEWNPDTSIVDKFFEELEKIEG